MEQDIQIMEIGQVKLSSRAKYWKNKAVGMRKLLMVASITMYILGILSGAFIFTFI